MISCALVSLVGGELHHFSFAAVSWSGWGAVVFLAIFGSIIAFIALYWLLARRPAPIVGTYAYINPVIAVILGYFIAKETISVTQVIGMVIILIAAWLANSVKFQSVE
jgi:drug/metabolite transporter (DMT)-like permease